MRSFSILYTIFIPGDFSESYVEVFDPNNEIEEGTLLEYGDKEIMVNEVQYNGTTSGLMVRLITNNRNDNLWLKEGEHLCAYI